MTKKNLSLSEMLLIAMRPYELNKQVDKIKVSDLPQPLKSVCELLFLSQWLEYRAKLLVGIFNSLTVKNHSLLKHTRNSIYRNTDKLPLGKLIDQLNGFKITDRKINDKYKKTLTDLKLFSETRNRYFHHYFENELDFGEIEKETKLEIKKAEKINQSLDEILDIWMKIEADELRREIEVNKISVDNL